MEDLRPSDYYALAQFRYQIRRFLHFSEAAARAEGIEAQHHQIMLAIRAWEGGAHEHSSPTIGSLAENLLLKHHSTVELVDRLEQRGLVERVRGTDDRRRVTVHLTGIGQDKLRHLARAHREELRSSGPILVEALGSLLQGIGGEAGVQ